MPSSPMTPSAVTAQNVDRQPNCWPSAVPPGTPSTFATVSPVNISAIALACFAFGTSDAATTEPTPKKAPWASAATIRPAIRTPYDGASADEQVARDEHAHQRDQHGLAGHLGPDRGEQRGADHDAERVAGDEQTGGRDGDAEVGRDLGQQAHDDELGGADPERTDGQREQMPQAWAGSLPRM